MLVLYDQIEHEAELLHFPLAAMACKLSLLTYSSGMQLIVVLRIDIYIYMQFSVHTIHLHDHMLVFIHIVLLVLVLCEGERTLSILASGKGWQQNTHCIAKIASVCIA
jgi:hypothetical protein